MLEQFARDEPGSPRNPRGSQQRSFVSRRRADWFNGRWWIYRGGALGAAAPGQAQLSNASAVIVVWAHA